MKKFFLIGILILSSAAFAGDCVEDLPLAEHMQRMYTTFDRIWASWDNVDNVQIKDAMIVDIKQLREQLAQSLKHMPSRLVRQPESLSKHLAVLDYQSMIVEMLALTIKLEKSYVEIREGAEGERQQRIEINMILTQMTKIVGQGHAKYRFGR